LIDQPGQFMRGLIVERPGVLRAAFRQRRADPLPVVVLAPGVFPVGVGRRADLLVPGQRWRLVLLEQRAPTGVLLSAEIIDRARPAETDTGFTWNFGWPILRGTRKRLRATTSRQFSLQLLDILLDQPLPGQRHVGRLCDLFCQLE
jgi:hypothetical protein